MNFYFKVNYHFDFQISSISSTPETPFPSVRAILDWGSFEM